MGGKMEVVGLKNNSKKGCSQTANFDGGLQLQQNRLRNEDLSSLHAQLSDFSLLEHHTSPSSPHLQQLCEDSIHIDIHYFCVRERESKGERGKRLVQKKKSWTSKGKERGVRKEKEQKHPKLPMKTSYRYFIYIQN